MRYKIFNGRFQPFHKGHLSVLEQVVADLKHDDILVVGIVSPFQNGEMSSIENTDYSKLVLEQLLPERNPWLPIVPMRAVSEILAGMNIKNRYLTTFMPSPSSNFSQIKKWFPSNRVWIIPNAGEEFDEKKAAFYLSQGEQVLRYEEKTGISGWDLRKHFLASDYNSFSRAVPKQVVDIYWNGEVKSEEEGKC